MKKRMNVIKNKNKFPKPLLIVSIFMFSFCFVTIKDSIDTYAQTGANQVINKYPNTILDTSKINDINYLKEAFYNIDSKTDISLSDIEVDKFLNEDFNIIIDGNKAKVLIFHTHSTEMYSDSKGAGDGVIAVGKKLKEILEQQYGIPTIHDTTAFDMVEGKWQPMGAYERTEKAILLILKENPSIEIIIDLHRDGIDENQKLVTTINSEPTAQISFVNGMSKIYKDGTLESMKGIPNEYIYNNLAFSFNMQLTANYLYPSYARKIQVSPYRYCLYMLPCSLLINVGAQTNTQAEAENSIVILAELLSKNILK